MAHRLRRLRLIGQSIELFPRITSPPIWRGSEAHASPTGMWDLLARLSRIALLFFNALMVVGGFSSLIFGAVLAFNRHQGMKMFKWMYSTDPFLTALSNTLINEDRFINATSLVFSLIGTGCIVIGLSGAYGAWDYHVGVLRFHVCLLALVMLQCIAYLVVLVFYKNFLRDSFTGFLYNLQTKYYVPLSTYTLNGKSEPKIKSTTHLINTIQVVFECCGMKKPGETGKNWLSLNSSWIGKRQVRPATCCKLYDIPRDKRSITRPNFSWKEMSYFLLDEHCPSISENIDWAINNKSCSQPVADFLFLYTNRFMYLIIPNTIALAVCIGFTVVMIVDEEYEDYDDDDYY